MSVEQVRPVIECLCQILASHGFSRITSETFRLAKFDNDEATVPMWRLIHELVQFDGTSEELGQKKFAATPRNEIVRAIKRDLFKRGYTYEHFLSLDGNMESGSRHLLVCLGWLIYHLRFVEGCMVQCLNKIFSSNDDTANSNKSDLIERIRKALLSNARVRARLKTYDRMDNSSASGRLSSFELQLRQYPHLVAQYLSELDDEERQLQLFVFWNEHENIFWKWMESVLDQPPVAGDQQTSTSEFGQLEAEKKKFHATIDQLDGALVRLEQLWISSNDHRPIERDVSMILASIDRQISSLFHELLHTHPLSVEQTLSK